MISLEDVMPFVNLLSEADKSRLIKILQNNTEIKPLNWREKRIREMQKKIEAKMFPPKK